MAFIDYRTAFPAADPEFLVISCTTYSDISLLMIYDSDGESDPEKDIASNICVCEV
jgi:hypothetical protein